MIFSHRRPEFVVQEAEPKDTAVISDLHGEAFARGWSSAELIRLSHGKGYTTLVARIVGRPGTAPVGFCIHRQTEFESEIVSIAASRAHRRAGIGGLLMRETIRRLQADRVPMLFLEVAEDNAGAVALYRRLGFEIVGNRPGYYPTLEAEGVKRPEKVDALVMRLTLG